MTRYFLALIGPSGVGKSTLIKALQATGSHAYIYPRTTRPLRGAEDDKVHLDLEQFTKAARTGELFNVNQVYGEHWYGYSRSVVQDILLAGKVPVCDVRADGLPKLRREWNATPVCAVYVLPPSVNVLAERLQRANRFDQRRFSEDVAELETFSSIAGIDAYVCNNNLDDCVKKLQHLAC